MKELHEIYWLDIKKVEENVKTDGKSSGNFIISGPFMRADIPNRNERIYPKDVANAAIAKLRPMVEEKRIRMQCDHPSFFDGPRLAQSAGLMLSITDVQEDGYAYYTAQILNTDSGKNLKAILEAGSKIGVSTRGCGESKEVEWIDSTGAKRNVEKIVNWDLQSVDFVDDPAVLDTEIYMKLRMESLQRRTSSMAKNIEELKSEYPEFCKQIAESATTDAKKEFETKITDLETQVKTIEESAKEKSSKIDAIIDSIKSSYPDKFTILNESEVIIAKDEEIKNLKKQLEEAKAKVVSLEKEIADGKQEMVKKERDSYLEQLKASDPDFFSYECFKNCFDSCVNKEEIKVVYEQNSKVVKEMKDKNQVPSNGKTVLTNDSADGKFSKLTDAQKVDFERRNYQRRVMMHLEPYTEDQYLAMYGTGVK